ncbi:MAG: chorismate mutase [Gemmatimonadales bacterium]
MSVSERSEPARLVLIAGPCSAETEAQVLETARGVAPLRPDYFRAGIWKARTRPGTFEGIGEPALPWLAAAGRASGLRTATEVATARHVEAALEHGIDALWIGARTTVNPFSVQELADALRGAPVPVFVKNPTSPDLALWLGAFERISAAGVGPVAGVFRGVSVADSEPYRNAPMWDLVLELRRQVPALPILVDPSHIAGRRDLLVPLAQRALDLGLDGLMIEAHPNPDAAWSDAAQQVTPERLAEIMAALHIRRQTSEDESYRRAMDAYRDRIDEVDAAILRLLAERMSVVERIAAEKRARNVTTFQVDRWRSLLEERMRNAERLGLDPDYAKAVYQVIHRESVTRQSAADEAGPER